MQIVNEDASWKSNQYSDYSNAQATVVKVYIIVIVVFVVLGLGGCIIACICGRAKTILGRILYPPATNQIQGVASAASPMTCAVMPGGNVAAFHNANFPQVTNTHEKDSSPPYYDEATTTGGFVKPTYHS